MASSPLSRRRHEPCPDCPRIVDVIYNTEHTGKCCSRYLKSRFFDHMSLRRIVRYIHLRELLTSPRKAIESIQHSRI
jgi:hypothetical protein